jgi:phage terminase large subunit-like protein
LQNLIRQTAQQKIREAREHLIPFSKYIDPKASKWYDAKHLKQIAEALERVERGELKRLLISVPPRHWKSSLASEKFPAWYLGRHPTHSLIIVSHTDTLATRFNSSVKATIESNALYKAVFPDLEIDPKMNRVDDWMLTTGYRSSCRSVGATGNITGWGANGIILDDTIANEAQAASDSQRDKLYNWYQMRVRTRLEPNGWIIGVNTRFHEDDLFGRLMEAQKNRMGEKWEVINIPAWNPETGYLWTERYSEEEYEAWRFAVGEFGWATQFMGQPTQAEGNEIKRSWFEYIPALPEGVVEQARTWDLAITLKTTNRSDPDYTASVGGAYHNGIIYLVNPQLYRAEGPELLGYIEAYKLEKPYVRIGMAKSLHETVIGQMLIRQGIPVEKYEEHGDIRVRAMAFIDMARQRRIVLVGTPEEWSGFMAQWAAFPNGKHDDAVAAVAGLMQMFHLNFRAFSPLPRVRKPIWEFAEM